VVAHYELDIAIPEERNGTGTGLISPSIHAKPFQPQHTVHISPLNNQIKQSSTIRKIGDLGIVFRG
jgi:hypothetical protein